MTEITRVPLPPIARGALPKLWLGVLAAGLVGVGVAAAGRPPMVDVRTITPGAGASPTEGDYVMINYVGRTSDGHVFDQANRVIFPVGKMIPGFTKALEQMQAGGKYAVDIPASLGYGDRPAGNIPPNSELKFTVELIDFKSAAEIEAQQRMIEQLRAMQAQRGGAAGAAPDGGAAAPGGAGPDGAAPGAMPQ